MLWVPLLEKAFAKLVGSWTRIASVLGYEDPAYILTGAPVKHYDTITDIMLDEKRKSNFWEKLKDFDKQDCMMMLHSQNATV